MKKTDYYKICEQKLKYKNYSDGRNKFCQLKLIPYICGVEFK
jgi:hypothetical protein